jgi:tripeptide aminopeptidase
MGGMVQHDIHDRTIKDSLVPRFLNYVRYWTESDRHREETPSTPGQWELAKVLAEELKALGLADVELTGHCYVIARIPPSPGKESLPALGFLAHLDTAGDVSGKDVQARLVEQYDGEKIELGPDLVLDPALDADLAAQKNGAIIHADGSTLLGADDKAGVAEIMGAVEYIQNHPEIAHGPVELIFSPDEETGKGLPEFPLERIASKVCYTLDGGPLGELEAECFNAWKADISFRGSVFHIGAARGRLANAALMASTFAVLLPRSEVPKPPTAITAITAPWKSGETWKTPPWRCFSGILTAGE